MSLTLTMSYHCPFITSNISTKHENGGLLAELHLGEKIMDLILNFMTYRRQKKTYLVKMKFSLVAFFLIEVK